MTTTHRPTNARALDGTDEGLTRLMNLATGYWASAALVAAVELGVFEAIAAGARTTADIADRCGCSRPHLEDLLRALAALSVVHTTPLGWQPAQELQVYLNPDSPRSLLPALAINRDLFPLWARLAHAVRTGRPPSEPGRHLGGDTDQTRRFVLAMHSRAMALADQLLPLADPGPVETLLDVGAGPGTLSRLLAERDPRLRITLSDLPPVLEIARELHAASPAASRLCFLPADYRQHREWGGPYEAILFCGTLHQESPESAADLFDRLRVHLEPNGRLIIVDLMSSGDRADPMAALFSLNMRLTSPQGRVWSVQEIAGLLERLGWNIRERRCATALPYWRIEAALPAARSTAL
ncbi:MAG: acetylserotonin O-methyltransferase [Kiritimatiellae bacterium]|nr:acetylserotonin O-methyltransferase [Kiritimatiellia bacterium]